MKRILVLGTGYVVKPLVDYFMDECKYGVFVASRDTDRSGQIIAGRPNGKRALWSAKPPYDELDRMVKGMDLVVSMIPPSLHPVVARACINNRVSMVTTSYIGPEMRALDDAAKEAGIVILNEIGEDPGLDHMGAQLMIDKIEAEGGKVKSLTSYGAGIPSFEHNRNPMGYKFSWSPMGLMRAGETPAVYIANGKRIEVSGEDLFKNNWLIDIHNLGTFETYPNRDSTNYIAEYGLDQDVDIYRGLLRFPGWCDTMQGFKDLDFFRSDNSQSLSGKTYRQFTGQLVGAPDSANVREVTAEYLGGKAGSELMSRYEWLGLFDDTPIAISKGANVDLLVDLMSRRMAYAAHEKDMIIVHNDIVAEFDNRLERRVSTMRVEGRPFGHSAMSRAVSLPAAIASRLIIEGAIRQKGVVMPTSPEIYNPVLAELLDHDYRFEHNTRVL